MDDFSVSILGCGAALPTSRHYPSSQVVHYRESLYMIDCGEGCQSQFRKMGLKINRLNHIFLSHLHGDHCLGLPGLISTLGLLGRTSPLTIHAHRDAERLFAPMIEYLCKQLPFPLEFHAIEPQKHEVIYETSTLKVLTIPLKHRIPTCGFLFEEKEKERHMLPDVVKFYQIPHYQIGNIKKGADFTLPDGTVIPNQRLTRDAEPVRRYAYCSDTLYQEKIIPYIQSADLLYHEATYGKEWEKRAKETFHSTAAQAATIARQAEVKSLIIGHFSARYKDNESSLLQEAQTIFPSTSLCKEGLTFKIGDK